MIELPEAVVLSRQLNETILGKRVKIEDILVELKKERTIIIVTHNMEQARCISDYTAFFYQGKIIEAVKTSELFSNHKTELLEKYISGKF